jgi:hypothetical protein
MPTVVCDADTDALSAASFLTLHYLPAVLDRTSVFATSVAGGLGTALYEDGDFSTDLTPGTLRLLDEVAAFGVAGLPRLRLRVIFSDALASSQELSVGASTDIAELGDFATELSSTRYLVLDSAGDFATLVAPRTTVVRQVDEAADFDTSLAAFKPSTLQAAGAFTTLVAPRSLVALQVDETADFDASDSSRAVVKASLDEAGDFVLALTSRSTVRVLAADEADLDAIAVVRSGAWTANTDTWAASRYDPFSFEAVASLQGRLFATGAAGLVRVAGDADAGAAIGSRVDTGLTEFKEPRLKLAHAIYLGYSSDSPLTATIGVTDAGSESRYDYPMPARAAAAMVSGRIPLGRGLRSRYMRVVLENTLGGAFHIDEAVLEVDVSTRRV